MQLLSQGRYEQALSTLEEAQRQSPDDMQIRKDLVRARELYGNRLVSVGNAERSAERFDRAEEAYAHALRVDPGNGRARTGLETVVMDRRHEAAIAEAQTLFNNADAAGATARLKEVFLENPNLLFS